MTKQPKTHHKIALWLPLLVLLLGSTLRLAAFQEALVGADQSSILTAAAEIAALRDLPQVGIKSSIGVMQTAVVAYLAAIPLFVLHRVIAIKWFFSVLDILALAFLYASTRHTFGRRAALATALLYATSPWIIEFNRWIWYQTLIPTFATVSFSALLLALHSDRHLARVMVIVAMVGATLMGLVHLAALAWAALLCVTAVGIGTWRQQRLATLTGTLLSALISTPYALFLLRSRFADVAAMLEQEKGVSGATWNWATYRLTLELLTGNQVLQTPRDPLWANSVIWCEALLWIVPILLGVAVVSVLWTMRVRSLDHRPLVFCLAWSILAPTLFLRTDIHLQHFYLLFVFPAPYVLIGVATSGWLRATAPTVTGQRAIRAFGALALCAVLILSAWWTHLWAIRIGYEQRGQLRAPTRAWVMDEMTRTVTRYLEEDSANQVIILTHFDDGGLSPFDWMRNFVHTDRIRVVPAQDGLIIPPSATCYVLAPGADLSDLSPVKDRIEQRDDLTIAASPSWSAYCTPARPALPESVATWQNGLSLIASEVTGEFAAGLELDITHTWHYRAQLDEEVHLFNHLESVSADQATKLVAQIDGAGVPTRYWRDDDVLVTRFRLELPSSLAPGAYRLRTGIYTWPELERGMLTDGRDGYEVMSWRP